MADKACPICGTSMKRRVRADAVYCSNACRQKAFVKRQEDLAKRQQRYVFGTEDLVQQEFPQDNIDVFYNRAVELTRKGRLG